jgi:hypothetical protein
VKAYWSVIGLPGNFPRSETSTTALEPFRDDSIGSTPYWYGSLALIINAPSRNIYSAYIGHRELTGLPLGQFQKLAFAVPSWIVSALQAGPYTDLTFQIALTVPAGPQTYLFDALQFDGAPRVDTFDVFAGGGTPADPDVSVSPMLVGAISQLTVSFYSRQAYSTIAFTCPNSARRAANAAIPKSSGTRNRVDGSFRSW